MFSNNWNLLFLEVIYVIPTSFVTNKVHLWKTGETSAGKSSIINLILGEELLPYSILSTTSTICELRYGEKPAIRVHFKGGSDYTQVPIYREFENSSEDLKKEIGDFLNLKDEREKGSPYQKVELFWPHDLLKVTITLSNPKKNKQKHKTKKLRNKIIRKKVFVDNGS